MKIQEMDLQTLKSIAYDTLVQIEQSQGNLRLINQEIALRQEKDVKKVN